MTAEGLLEIDLQEFYEWLAKYHGFKGEAFYGVPRINKGNGTLEVDFACGTDGSPADWAVEPVAVKQWRALP